MTAVINHSANHWIAEPNRLCTAWPYAPELSGAVPGLGPLSRVSVYIVLSVYCGTVPPIRFLLEERNTESLFQSALLRCLDDGDEKSLKSYTMWALSLIWFHNFPKFSNNLASGQSHPIRSQIVEMIIYLQMWTTIAIDNPTKISYNSLWVVTCKGWRATALTPCHYRLQHLTLPLSGLTI